MLIQISTQVHAELLPLLKWTGKAECSVGLYEESSCTGWEEQKIKTWLSLVTICNPTSTCNVYTHTINYNLKHSASRFSCFVLWSRNPTLTPFCFFTLSVSNTCQHLFEGASCSPHQQGLRSSQGLTLSEIFINWPKFSNVKRERREFNNSGLVLCLPAWASLSLIFPTLLFM